MGATVSIPTFSIGFLFHADPAIFERTLPRSLTALATGTAESYEVIVQCDGTPPEVARQPPDQVATWGVDERVLRRRERFVAGGCVSNNGHRRQISAAGQTKVRTTAHPIVDSVPVSMRLVERREITVSFPGGTAWDG